MSYTQYQQYGGNPYNNGPDAEAGLGAPGQASQPGSGGLQHEMTNFSTTSQYSQPGAGTGAAVADGPLSQQQFLERVDYAKAEIRTLNSQIQQIATLHQKALSSPENTSSTQLEDLVSQTQLKNSQIRDLIKSLERDASKSKENAVKARQAKQLKADFEKTLRDYQQEELGYRQRYRDQIARQFRIVSPDASEAEVKEAIDMDWHDVGVFQAALQANRSGQATSVLGAVRARHSELQRIESTLLDIASLFQEMASLVEAQDDIVAETEQNATKTVEDMDKANTQITKATDHIRTRNKLRRYCILVGILIILVLALGIGLGVGLAKNN